MVFRCCFWLFNDGIFLVIHSPNFRMFWTFNSCIILSIVFWRVFSFQNMTSSEDRRVSLEDDIAFVRTNADSDFSCDFSEEEEDSSEEEIVVNEEHSTTPKRCRTKGALCRRTRTGRGQKKMNNFHRENLENRWKTEEKDPILPAFSGEPGIKIDCPDSCDELDIFKCFITDELIDYITKETNKYASRNQ